MPRMTPADLIAKGYGMDGNKLRPEQAAWIASLRIWNEVKVGVRVGRGRVVDV